MKKHKTAKRIFALALGVWFFVGDAVRKMIPGQPVEMMFVLDALILALYFLMVWESVRHGKRLWKPPFPVPLAVFAVVFLINVLMHFEGGWGVVALGFRTYLWFIPLAVVGHNVFETKEETLIFFRRILWITIPLLALSVAQATFSGSDFVLLKPFVGGHEEHAGPFQLTTSFFGSAQRFGMASMLLFLIGLGAQSMFAVPAFAGVLLSGSGSAFVLSVLGIALFIRRPQVRKIILVLLMAVVILAGIPVFSKTVISQAERIPMVLTSRIFIFAGEMRALSSEHTSLFGQGAGVVSQGIDRIVLERPVATPPSLGETGIRNLLVEMGLFGLAAFYLMWGSVLWVMYKELKAITDPHMRPMGFSLFLFTLFVLIRFTFVHGQTLNDYAVLIPLWFLTGVFFKMRHL